MRISVALTSCNRDRFLVEAIESVLAQEVDGDYEIVVGDDASGPRTREILTDYRARYPEKVRLLLHERNLGLVRNFASVFDACRGQYVAMLDDDDLWVSPQKLRHQAAYLDDHPDCTLCFHDSRHFHDDGSQPDHFVFLRRRAEQYGLDDLRAGGFIPTSAAMFRRSVIAPLPPWFLNLRSHEWTIHLLCAKRGTVGYIDEPLAATRIHAGGKWNGKTAIQQYEQIIHNTTTLEANLPFMRGPTTDFLLARAYFELASEYGRNGDFDRASLWAWRSLHKCPSHPALPFAPRLRRLMASFGRSIDARLRHSKARNAPKAGTP